MFPFLSDLIRYIFGVELRLPIPTFGFFVALAFVLAYLCFLHEFKRKEAVGIIKEKSFPIGLAIGKITKFARFFSDRINK